MAIRSLVLDIIYSYPVVTEDGRQYTGSRSVNVVLPDGDLRAFLDALPDDIDEYSMAWLTVERPDGKMISYVDGVQPASEGYGLGPLVRFAEMGEEYADAVRKQASREARRAVDRARGVVGPPGEATLTEFADAELEPPAHLVDE